MPSKPSINPVLMHVVIAALVTALFTVSGHFAPAPFVRFYQSARVVMEEELALIGACFFGVLALSFGTRHLIMFASSRVRPVHWGDVIRWLTGWRLVLAAKLVTLAVLGITQFVPPFSDALRAAIVGQPFVDWQIANRTLAFVSGYCLSWGALVTTGYFGRIYVWPETKKRTRQSATMTSQAL